MTIMDTKPKNLMKNLNIIWTIAYKDILDGLKNKVVLSIVAGVLFMLSMPALMAWMIEPPFANVLVFDPGSSQLVNLIDEDEAFRVQRLPSLEAFEEAVANLGFGVGIEYGLMVPADFDEKAENNGEAVVEVYVPWSFRKKIPELKEQIEAQLTALRGVTVTANFEQNIVYPPPQSTLTMGLTTQMPVIIILMVGLSMMPHLFFEEKQTRTMDAMLVSPATEGQIVAGKAVVGMFYILVTAFIAFGLNWTRVVHWELVAIFVVFGGLFGVGVGVILGTFFNRYQEIFGWSMLLLLVLIAAIFIQMLEVDLPGWAQTVIPWIPSAGMAKIVIASFMQEIDWGMVFDNIASVLAISAVMYSLIAWRLRRSDR